MKKNNIKKQSIVVICGVKNSGKTTLITKLIPKFTSLGYKVATIKHDGHDFDADVEGTDSPNKSKEFLGSIPALGLLPGWPGVCLGFDW